MDNSDKENNVFIVCALIGFIVMFSVIALDSYFREKTKQMAIEKAATLVELRAAQGTDGE